MKLSISTLILCLLASFALSCANNKGIVDKATEKVTDKASAKLQTPLKNACEISGPQTPRDISNKAGTNAITFEAAPATSKMNLCNIHFHKNAEHKGPEFSVFKGNTKTGGYACNATKYLTPAQLKPVSGACDGITVGDTVEVHWVHSSCDIKPGPTLGSCLAESCKNPVLKVETQVFLLVNDSGADSFAAYKYNKASQGMHQAKALPPRNGAVQFLGSTTGPKFNNKTCSPFKVNWSVSKACRTLDIKTLHKWCASNIFKEDHAHGVRELVTDERFLSLIK